MLCCDLLKIRLKGSKKISLERLQWIKISIPVFEWYHNLWHRCHVLTTKWGLKRENEWIMNESSNHLPTGTPRRIISFLRFCFVFQNSILLFLCCVFYIDFILKTYSSFRQNKDWRNFWYLKIISRLCIQTCLWGSQLTQMHLSEQTINSLTAEWALRALMDFFLSNARRFYSSIGNPLAEKGLKSEERNLRWRMGSQFTQMHLSDKKVKNRRTKTKMKSTILVNRRSTTNNGW